MKNLHNAFSRVFYDRKGVTALEYTILAVAIILVIVGVTGGLQAPIEAAWTSIVTALS